MRDLLGGFVFTAGLIFGAGSVYLIVNLAFAILNFIRDFAH